MRKIIYADVLMRIGMYVGVGVGIGVGVGMGVVFAFFYLNCLQICSFLIRSL